MEERPDMYAEYQKALKKQKVSFALDLTGLSLMLLTYAYLFSTQFQSSTPSKLVIPFVITNLGLNLTSSQMRRRARNLTRHALDKYNFGETYIPVVKHHSMEFTGPSVTLFNRSFQSCAQNLGMIVNIIPSPQTTHPNPAQNPQCIERVPGPLR